MDAELQRKPPGTSPAFSSGSSSTPDPLLNAEIDHLLENLIPGSAEKEVTSSFSPAPPWPERQMPPLRTAVRTRLFQREDGDWLPTEDTFAWNNEGEGGTEANEHNGGEQEGETTAGKRGGETEGEKVGPIGGTSVEKEGSVKSGGSSARYEAERTRKGKNVVEENCGESPGVQRRENEGYLPAKGGTEKGHEGIAAPKQEGVPVALPQERGGQAGSRIVIELDEEEEGGFKTAVDGDGIGRANKGGGSGGGSKQTEKKTAPSLVELSSDEEELEAKAKTDRAERLKATRAANRREAKERVQAAGVIRLDEEEPEAAGGPVEGAEGLRSGEVLCNKEQGVGERERGNVAGIKGHQKVENDNVVGVASRRKVENEGQVEGREESEPSKGGASQGVRFRREESPIEEGGNYDVPPTMYGGRTSAEFLKFAPPLLERLEALSGKKTSAPTKRPAESASLETPAKKKRRAESGSVCFANRLQELRAEAGGVFTPPAQRKGTTGAAPKSNAELSDTVTGPGIVELRGVGAERASESGGEFKTAKFGGGAELPSVSNSKGQGAEARLNSAPEKARQKAATQTTSAAAATGGDRAVGSSPPCRASADAGGSLPSSSKATSDRGGSAAGQKNGVKSPKAPSRVLGSGTFFARGSGSGPVGRGKDFAKSPQKPSFLQGKTILKRKDPQELERGRNRPGVRLEAVRDELALLGDDLLAACQGTLKAKWKAKWTKVRTAETLNQLKNHLGWLPETVASGIKGRSGVWGRWKRRLDGCEELAELRALVQELRREAEEAGELERDTPAVRQEMPDGSAGPDLDLQPSPDQIRLPESSDPPPNQADESKPRNESPNPGAFASMDGAETRPSVSGQPAANESRGSDSAVNPRQRPSGMGAEPISTAKEGRGGRVGLENAAESASFGGGFGKASSEGDAGASGGRTGDSDEPLAARKRRERDAEEGSPSPAPMRRPVFVVKSAPGGPKRKVTAKRRVFGGFVGVQGRSPEEKSVEAARSAAQGGASSLGVRNSDARTGNLQGASEMEAAAQPGDGVAALPGTSCQGAAVVSGGGPVTKPESSASPLGAAVGVGNRPPVSAPAEAFVGEPNVEIDAPAKRILDARHFRYWPHNSYPIQVPCQSKNCVIAEGKTKWPYKCLCVPVARKPWTPRCTCESKCACKPCKCRELWDAFGTGCVAERFLKRGALKRMRVYDTGTKGLGVMAMETIEEGDVVAEKCGEVVHKHELAARQSAYQQRRLGCYVTQLDTRYSVDQTQNGNVTRFFNHSCDGGNLDLILVKCGSPENPWGDDGPPAALLRAKRRIEVGEELTWNYNLLDGTGKPFRASGGTVECQCGSESCSRFSFDR